MKKIALIIIFLLILTGCTKKDNYEEIFEEFINNKEYLKDFTNISDSINYNYYYSMFDLDNDNIKELIIIIKDDTDFETNLFYKIEDNKVSFIDKKYHYGNLSFNTIDKAIIYSEYRPSLSYGWVYELYKLESNSFNNIKNYVIEIDNNNYKYYINYDKDNKEDITKEEYDKYMDNNIIIERKPTKSH